MHGHKPEYQKKLLLFFALFTLKYCLQTSEQNDIFEILSSYLKKENLQAGKTAILAFQVRN